jgi:hypothetical protein
MNNKPKTINDIIIIIVFINFVIINLIFNKFLVCCLFF